MIAQDIVNDLEAALEQFREWRIETVAATLAGINARIAAGLERLGFTMPSVSGRCPHMIGAVVPLVAANIAIFVPSREIAWQATQWLGPAGP